jgi:hypothetical protein
LDLLLKQIHARENFPARFDMKPCANHVPVLPRKVPEGHGRKYSGADRAAVPTKPIDSPNSFRTNGQLYSNMWQREQVLTWLRARPHQNPRKEEKKLAEGIGKYE